MTDQTRKRNQLCPCGSGLKFKRCCRGKKPREQQFFAVSQPIGTWLPGGVIPAGTTWTAQISDGQARVFIEGKEIPFGPVYVKDSYSRAGKRNKILRQVPLRTFAPRDMLDPAAASTSLLSYDWIFVIDTNTKAIAGEQYSVACSMVCRAERTSDHTANVHNKGFATFQYRGLTASDAEKQALVDLVKLIRVNRSYRPTQSIALVTDHDLGAHMAINNHELPLRDGAKLPDNFRLVYASADSGGENPLNRAMALCDKAASRILNGKVVGTVSK